MIRPIVKYPIFLRRRARNATAEDLPIARDLLDTLAAHREVCVGMAANMIGEAVRIIAFYNKGVLQLMFNPEIVKASGFYETEEGCLSLSGVRRTRRSRIIQVRYQDETMKTCRGTFTGWTAQIIQHEIDHCGGILI